MASFTIENASICNAAPMWAGHTSSATPTKARTPMRGRSLFRGRRTFTHGAIEAKAREAIRNRTAAKPTGE
jgi:hypothetical protein